MRSRTFRTTFGPFGFRFGWWEPFGFADASERPFRRRSYLRWLRRYKRELEEELRDVEEEIQELERESEGGAEA